MKKIGKIMEELGFNKNASDDVKKAFVKNLIKAAAEQDELAHRQMGVQSLQSELENNQNALSSDQPQLEENINIDSFNVERLEDIQKSMDGSSRGVRKIIEVQLSLFEQIDGSQGKKTS